MSLRRHPYWVHFSIGLVAAVAATFWLRSVAGDTLVDPLPWLIAISAVTFLVWGYDKAIAGREISRVPERVLLLLTLIGGTPGALAGMSLFRHKTIKGSFRAAFFATVAAQVAALGVWWFWPQIRASV